MYTDIPETREVNGKVYIVKMVVDNDPDLSYLGKFTSKDPDEYCVDRKLGILRGKGTAEPCEDDFANPFYTGTYGSDDDPDHFEIDWPLYDDAYSTWETQPYEVLAEFLPRAERNEYEFFILPDSGEEKGSPDWIKYAVQDYKRISDYNRREWCMVGIVVREKDACPTCGLSSSLWSIESDSDDKYIESVIEDLIGELA